MRTTLIILVCAGLTLAPVAEADTLVTPSDRISQRLNVRLYPTTADSSDVVGKLLKNETALYLESVPSWFKLRLANGVEGWVYKAYADTFAGAFGDDPTRLRVGAWNIKKLGHGSSKDYGAVATIIENHFDVVAVVEVMQKGGTHPGFDDLTDALGTGWSSTVTSEPRPNTGDGHAEYYALLWRDGSARLCAGWDGLVYFEEDDGGPDGTDHDHFDREPAFACMEMLDDTGDPVGDFVIAAYHARWEGGDTDAIQGEVANIDEVIAAMASAAPGEEDLWVVGDFNLVPDDLVGQTTATDICVGTGSTLNSSGARTLNLYEHFLVRDRAASSEILGDARIIDVRETVTADDVFYGSVSDHLPMVVEVESDADDD